MTLLHLLLLVLSLFCSVFLLHLFFAIGCEFIATKHEYRYIWYKVGCYAPCPTCGIDAREREDWDWY